MKRKADTQLTPDDIDLDENISAPPNSFSKASEDELNARKMVQIKKHDEEEIANFFFDEDSDIVLDDDYERRKKTKASPDQDLLSNEQNDVLMGDQNVDTVTGDVLDDGASSANDVVMGDKISESAPLVSASDIASTNTTEKPIGEPTPITNAEVAKIVPPSQPDENAKSDISTQDNTTALTQPVFGKATFGVIKTPGPKTESFGSFELNSQPNDEEDTMAGTKDKPFIGVPAFKPADTVKPIETSAVVINDKKEEVGAAPVEKKTFSFTPSDKKSSFSLKSSFGSNTNGPILALNPVFGSDKDASTKSTFGDKPTFPRVSSFGSGGSTLGSTGFASFGSQEKGKATSESETTATLSVGTPKAIFGSVTTPSTGSAVIKTGFGLGGKTSSFGDAKSTGFGDIKTTGSGSFGSSKSTGFGDIKTTSFGSFGSTGGFGKKDSSSALQSFGSLGNGTDSSFFSNNSNEVTKDDDFSPVLGSENVAPLLTKPDNIITGEEEEETLFDGMSKLYRFTDKWENVAQGKITLNKAKAENKYRLILRTEGGFKLKLNAPIFAEMNPTKSEGNKVSFIAKNLCTPEEELSSFVVRFQSPEITDNFFNVFTKSIQSL